MEAVFKWTKARVNRDKKKSCGRKVRYSNYEDADRHAQLLMMRDGRHSSAYQCRYCKGYHAGHTPYNKIAAYMEAISNGD